MVKQYFPIGTLPLTFLALVFLIYVGWGWFAPKPPPKPDATWTRVKQEGVLKIGVDPSFPPFETDDGKGNLSGFDVALASALANKWNVRVQYVYTGFDGLYDALVGNQFDMILSALPYNPAKTEDVNFSHAYFNGGPVLVVRAEDDQIKSFYDLAGRNVAVELGTSGDAFARRWQRRLRLDLREFDTAKQVLNAAQSGQVAAAIVDPISFYDFQRAGNTVKIVGKALSDELYIIAVRKDAPTLLAEINALLDAMTRDKSLEELQKKWF